MDCEYYSTKRGYLSWGGRETEKDYKVEKQKRAAVGSPFHNKKLRLIFILVPICTFFYLNFTRKYDIISIQITVKR